MKTLLLVWLLFCLGSMPFLNKEEAFEVHTVTMKNMRFHPDKLEIKVGDKVRWVNESNMKHNVEADDEKSFKCDLLKHGEQFEFTFTRAGTYPYHCHPHHLMGMKATIIVKE